MQPPQTCHDASDSRWTDLYENGKYGYRVRIPTGLAAWSGPSPGPQHGFVIPLGAAWDRWIGVDAEWNNEDRSAKEPSDLTLAWLRKQPLREPRMAARRDVTLDSLRGVLIRCDYRCDGDRDQHVLQQVDILTPDGSVELEVWLCTTDEHLKEDARVWREVLRSLRYGKRFYAR